MDWLQGWEIDEAGLLQWAARFGIHNDALKIMYIADGVIHLTVQTFAERGVKVGAA
jgi:hypothetical protein